MAPQDFAGIFADVSTPQARPTVVVPSTATTTTRDGGLKTVRTVRPSLPHHEDSTMEKDLDWVDDNVIAKGKKAYEKVGSLASPLKKGFDAISDPAKDALNAMVDSNDPAFKAIADNITTWAEKSEALMKTLDGVAQIHPIIGVAVLVFKTAVELEMQRRDNDQKVGALRVLRMDMMSVLSDLGHVSDTASVAGDRGLSDLIKKTADDIRACSQTCEKYLEKKLIVKILKSNSWHNKLDSFSKVFQDRKGQFQFALSVYTSKGVTQANEAIGVVQGTIDTTNESVNMMLLFKYLESPSERALMGQIRAKGGASKVLASDKLLQELIEGNPSALATSTLNGASSERSAGVDETRTIQALKKDLNESIDSMLQKERALFDAKFDIQTRQLAELEKKVTRESDRIITTLMAGPGDRIKDKAIHAMWKEMAWKTSARTTRFVLALRDYYLEMYIEHPAPAGGDPQSAEGAEDRRSLPEPLPASEKWTLSYIGFPRLQPISESFDDDASGFITVQEINTFTSSRPLDWSVPRWIAFWALGWHLSMTHYAYKLNNRLVPSMLKLSQKVLSSNKGVVDRYLSSDSFRKINLIFMSLTDCCDDDNLLERFQGYVEREERRLETNCQALAFELDNLNTLKIVTGPGRLERFLLPLIYLLLSHHYRLIELATREIVPEAEFLAASDTLFLVWLATFERVVMLKVVYEQQHIDVDKQMERCMHGLLESTHSPKKVEATENEEEYPEDEGTESVVTGKLERKDLKHLPDDNELRDYSNAVRDDRRQMTPSSAAVASLAGWWDGILYDDDKEAMGRISFFILPPNDGKFSGFGIGPWGPINIQPFATAVMENIVLRLMPNTPGDNGMEFRTTSFTNGIVTGKWKTAVEGGSLTSDAEAGRFVVERRSFLAVQRSRPAPDAFKRNRSRTLWSIARSAVHQHMWSWTFFKERKAVRMRYVELTVKDILYDKWSDQIDVLPLTDEEEEEMTTLHVTLSARDQQLYRLIAERSSGGFMPSHPDIACDICDEPVGAVRFACMTCIGDRVFETIDLCSEHQNESAGEDEPNLKHNNTHPMLKARRVIHFRDFLRLRNLAKEYCDEASALYAGGDDTDDDGDKGGDEDGNEDEGEAREEAEVKEEAEVEDEVEDDDDDDSDAEMDAEGDDSDNEMNEAGDETEDDAEAETGADEEDTDTENEPELSPPACIGCKKLLQAPYYVCVDGDCRTDDHFLTTLCESCENDEKWRSPTHILDHLLLRVPQPSSDETSKTLPNPLEVRLASLERHYSEHTSTMEKPFQTFETKVDERFSRLEGLLEKLALHLNVN